jgi:hypothetical protein
MSDDLKNRGPADRNRVNVHEKWEVEYWTKALGCTEAELRDCAKNSVMVEDVRRAWSRRRKNSETSIPVINTKATDRRTRDRLQLAVFDNCIVDRLCSIPEAHHRGLVPTEVECKRRETEEKMETAASSSLRKTVSKFHVWITVVLSVLHISLACILPRDSGRADQLSIA